MLKIVSALLLAAMFIGCSESATTEAAPATEEAAAPTEEAAMPAAEENATEATATEEAAMPAAEEAPAAEAK